MFMIIYLVVVVVCIVDHLRGRDAEYGLAHIILYIRYR
jgi:hypothetical protein